MEVIDRYIYAVTQRLPEQQREDIKRELQSLIEDMLEERMPRGQASKEDVESVLLELGPPNELAAKYRGYERYLIGPMLIDAYLTTLKIVLASIVIGLTAVFIIDTFLSHSGKLDPVTSYLASLVTGAAQGFAWVTVVFAWMEYRQRVGNGSRNKTWRPSDLPLIPDAKLKINRIRPILSIFFTIAVMMICLYLTDLLGIWRNRDGVFTSVPYLDNDVFRHYWPLLWIVAALSITKQIVRIIVRYRSSKLLAFHIVMTIITTMLVCIMLSDQTLWNPHFIRDLTASNLIPAEGDNFKTLVSTWPRASEWLINAIVLFACLNILRESLAWYRAKSSSSPIPQKKPLV
ncbi:permease prefix domain 1-containing protein [Paenibacillus chitinolyticus]|uniref:HAAS signaling domain-containing protein n=1 Tax=Paenibacillus chitinolyticus TaxID=79263 RepID=UPI0035578C0E